MTVTMQFSDIEIIIPGRTLYYICFSFAQGCGIISFFLLTYALSEYAGISWNIESRFFIHPFLMLLGMVYLQGTSISAFRALNNVDRLLVKYFHAVVPSIIFVLTVIALSAVFDNVNHQKGNHLVTFHGWLGICTVLLFCMQWVCGFLAYFLLPMLPIASANIRMTYMPYHRACGLFSFSLAIICTLTGLSKLEAFMAMESVPFAVCLPMLILIFGIVTLMTVLLKIFKRDNMFD